MVKLGSAHGDENGHAKGGVAGDQTKREVSIENFYMHSKGWLAFKPKSKDVAKRLAQAMRDACANDIIGYDQGERLGVYKWVREGTAIKSINKPTECDCSSLVRACILEATGKSLANFSTINEADVLKSSGLFDEPFIVKSAEDMEEGMIVVTRTKGHTCICTEGKPPTGSTAQSKPTPVPTTKLEPSQFFEEELKGTYRSIAQLNMRNGAGTTKAVLLELPFGAEVKCYGYFNKIVNDKWLAVTYEGHTGYCSAKYLKKIT